VSVVTDCLYCVFKRVSACFFVGLSVSQFAYLSQFTCLSCQFAYLFLCLSVSLSVCVLVCLSVCLMSVCHLSVPQSVYHLPVCMYIRLSVCLFVFASLPLCLYVCLSVCLSEDVTDPIFSEFHHQLLLICRPTDSFFPTLLQNLGPVT